MRFLCFYHPTHVIPEGPARERHMAEMGAFIEDSMKRGELIATGGLLPVAVGGVRLVRAGGEISVTDGPFAEAKEMIAGFALLEAPSRPAVIDMVKRFLAVAGDGETEVRQVMD